MTTNIPAVLADLEATHDAGAISDTEYQQRKDALQAELAQAKQTVLKSIVGLSVAGLMILGAFILVLVAIAG